MNAPQKNFEQARYGIDSYKDWLKAEGLKVVEGLAIDCTEVETAEWPRVGARAAALHLDGRGDFCNMLLYELGPGKSTLPQRHLFEEVIYVVEGVGKHAARTAERRAPQLRMGTHESLCDPAQREISPLQLERRRARGSRQHDQPADDAQSLPQRAIRLRQ